VWQNTTQNSSVWDRPVYEEFFRAVREINSSSPRDRQLRVLLGDPPVDWDSLRDGARNIWTPDRDRHAADLIRREVLDKGRRALVLYGDAHLFRAGLRAITVQIERSARAGILAITTAISSSKFGLLSTVQPDVASWPVPSIARVRGTALDAQQFQYYDALLYLGPPSTMTTSQLAPELCSDSTYMEMRLRRMASNQRGVRQLKNYCASLIGESSR
jgi:hypothetical protein